jgi:hypothetical protein
VGTSRLESRNPNQVERSENMTKIARTTSTIARGIIWNSQK